MSSKNGTLWKTLSYEELASQVQNFALGLRTHGIQKGDRVAILSENRTEWTVADLGALAAGAVTVPIYPTLPPSQILPLLVDSGATAIVVSDSKQLEKISTSHGETPHLQHIILMDESTVSGDVLSFSSVLEIGAESKGMDFDSMNESVSPTDLMSIIYTSGTTGTPKGVMLTHANMCAALDGVQHDFTRFVPPNEVFLSFLPLCHIYERVVSCLSITNGAHTYYNESIFKLIDNIVSLKPTIMTNVPRVYESIHERVLADVIKMPKRRQAIFRWALETGERTAMRRNSGKLITPILFLKSRLADKLVLSKVRQKFGGHLKFFVTGGAPLSPQTGAFFQAIGTPILEGWGLTETTGPATVNPYGRVKLGTVGRHSNNVEVQVATDGELIVRGPTVMRGYWNKPEDTADVLDKDGWFHTGDIGEIDRNGYVEITDRKKDLLVLANGKKVAPQPIETLLKRSPYIADIVLLGDNTGFVSALVVPDFERVKSWGIDQGKTIGNMPDFSENPDIQRLMKSEIDRLSKDLADFERIKRIALLSAPLTIEAGELTPTLKIKRKVVAEKYGYLLTKE